MNLLESLVEKEAKKAVEQLYSATVESEQLQLQETRKDFEGDITLVVFPLLKFSKQKPEQTAEEIGNFLQNSSDLIQSFQVVKGFLNLSVDLAYWLNFFQDKKDDENFGFQPAKSKAPLMVEYSSPNTNKPLHLGHLRNNFLGNSIARILEANGHEVIKVQIINDRGIHICKSMLAWKKFGNGETPRVLKGDHLVGTYYVEFDKRYKAQIKELINSGRTKEEAEQEAPLINEAREMLRKWEAGNPEVRDLWKTMNQWVYEGFEETYQTMGVDFDRLYYESDTYQIGKEKIEQHLESQLLYKKEDGSVWVDLSAEKLDDKLVLRSDGTSVYITQDIGTAILREEEFHCERYYYVVGNEQDYHFTVLAIILKKMGYSWAEGIQHISYGMVDLPTGKMKSREGTVVDADDIMQEMKHTARVISSQQGKLEELDEDDKEKLYAIIGLGALKYFILKVDPKKRMLFNPEESVDFNGNTGPFIQYAYARISSILRKAAPLAPTKEIIQAADLDELDISLLKQLHSFPEVLEEASTQLSPAIIANFTFDLVKTFNHYYQNIPSIVKEENQALRYFRLNLIKMVGTTIKNSCHLLGMQVPKRM